MSMTRRRLLDDTYKKTASGNPVIARTVARMNPDLKIHGWTEQDEYSGVQLLDTAGIQSDGDIWIERLNDGSILVNAPTKSEAYYLTLSKEISLPNGTYYATTGRSDVKLVIIMTVQGADDYEYALNQSFTVDDTVTLIQWRLQIAPNTASVENEIVYPMINVGTSALPWEPYTGGKPAPNPDYPIPWHNAGEVMTTGAQVYDQSLAQDNLYQNYDIANQNLAISNNPGYWISGKVPVKPNTTYSMNRKQDGGCFYSDENTPITTSVILAGRTFTTPENCNFVVFNFVKTSTVFGTAIMMNVGSAALPWEPYTNGVPAVNPYKGQVDVNITGRNLFDASLFTDEDLAGTLVTNNGDGSFTVPDSYTEWVGMYIKKDLSDEMTRKLFRLGTLHINCGKATYPYFEINFYKNGEIVATKAFISSASSDLVLPNNYFEKNNGDEIYVRYVIYSAPDGEAKYKPGTFRPMIYYEGNGDFEPYKEPQSIPITLDAPLSKWDRIEKRNGMWGVVRKSAEIVLDGSGDENWIRYTNDYMNYYVFIYRNIPNRQIDAVSFSNKFFYSDDPLNMINDSLYSKNAYFGGTNIAIRHDEILDIEEFRTYLQAEKPSILYETEEETFEPFDVSQQEILNAIHTYNPSTSVFNWQNCDMDFTYKTRKSVENYE